MRSPKWPDASQMIALHKNDALQTLTPPSTVTSNSQGEVTLDFDLPMPAVSFIRVASVR